MAKIIHFKKVRPKRSKRREYSGGLNSGLVTAVILILIAGLVFALGSHMVSRVSTVSSSAQSTIKDVSWQQEVLKNILSQNIPGMVELENTDGVDMDMVKDDEIALKPDKNHNDNMLKSTLYALTRVNPDDPKTFLNSQLTSMEMVSLLAESYSLEDDSIMMEKIQQEEELMEGNPNDHLMNSSLGQELSPLVIIYHSHTTESFFPTSGQNYTTDLSQTVVRVAEEIIQYLENDYGIKVIHNKEIHNIPHNEAYSKSIETVKELVKRYPEAAMVIDLHRDGVSREVSTTQINGQDVGKTLIVLGSDHSRWKQNYGFAYNFHEKSEELYPGLSRGISERRFTYNQEVHPQAILLEIGGHRNSLEEALRTGRYVAEIIGELFKEL
ncbi:stage II sporulation protein P [Candidatus Contubernalis alkaliaceticus]|uniref:stage II sporulation protein P n=1 Tax=Candidatus Contubernalis alkaliaceticus TaxID=338645 RepID=UPI001F4BD598|nr:stage II sporulation protein P [Candidatus Contubernalis alkalaceticus]UNC93244.1 stage II sporulation protein P [Candidatus Contubernalis alkalaceticus]